MKKIIERYSFLILVLVIILGGFLFGYYAWAYNPGTNITLCTGSVSQPACYDTAYPTPTVNWTVTGSSNQASYQVQIDQNQNFNNPEIDTGEVVSGSVSYQVNQSGLLFGHTYYWRIRVRDNYDSLSDWATADTSFTAVDSCNQPPVATDLSVSNADSATYCNTAAHYFSWTYSDPDGHTQSKFQFQVDNNSNFTSSEIDREFTGLSDPSPTVNNQTVIVAESPGAGQIGYNDTYYWRVKVYDSWGADSGWITGSSFSTAPHRYPNLDFYWTPSDPELEEDVIFLDWSTVYGGTTKSVWSWMFEDGTPATSNQQNPIVTFSSIGSKDVVLQVTDSDGLTCSGSGDGLQVVSVQFGLPCWQEVSPF